jgi:multiple antibiotic resistance protein
MHDTLKAFLLVFSALFPIVDPLSASPIFLALTRHFRPATRKELSWSVTLNSFVLMVASYFLGSHVLKFFGVSLPALQVGGGLVVVAFGWTLLMEKDGHRHGTAEAAPSQENSQRAFYPLTLPLTIGPGAISVAITVGAHTSHNYGVHLSIILAALLAMGVVAASIFFCYRFAAWLCQMLGETGTTIVIRLSSFLLVCLGVQIIWNGVEALLASLHFLACVTWTLPPSPATNTNIPSSAWTALG